MKKKIILILSFWTIIVLTCFGSNTKLEQFQYRNQILNIDSTWNQIRLPNTVLANSEQSLKDIRIYGVSQRDSIEIPYFITPKYDSYGVNYFQKDSKEKLDVIPSISNSISSSNKTLVEIVFPKRISFSSITFFTDYKHEYKRRAYLKYIRYPQANYDNYKPILEELKTLSLSSEGSNTFEFENIITDQIVLEIPNHDNQALEISNIELSESVHFLVGRFEPNYQYYLYYGNRNKYRPNYDIVNFVDKIPDSLNQAELAEGESLFEAPSENDKNDDLTDKTLLWIVIGLLSIGLIYFSITLLKK